METPAIYSSVIACVWIFSSVFLQHSDASSLSLWGEKVDFMQRQCSYWQLRDGLVVPALEELSVCVDLWKEISTPRWTAFMYKQRGEEREELGLGGTVTALRVWLFGQEWTTPTHLPLRSWHTLCLSWSGEHVRLYMDGKRVLIGKLDHFRRRRRLAHNGTLTLGMSHGFVGGEMQTEMGTNFQGEVSLFRLWGQARNGHQLSALSCVEGEVIRWSILDWETHGCLPVTDTRIQCAGSLYEIEMNILITFLDGRNPSIHAAGESVNEWLRSIFPPNVTVYTVFIYFSTRPGHLLDEKHRKEVQETTLQNSPIQTWFDCEVYVSVIPRNDVTKVQAELTRLLSTQYTTDRLRLTVNYGSISVNPVEGFPSVTLPTPDVGTTVSTVKTTSFSSPSTSLTPETGPPTPIPGPTDTATPTSQGPVHEHRDTFYRVRVNVTVTGAVHDPEEIIQTWLSHCLPMDQMTVLNFRLLTSTTRQLPSALEWMTQEFGRSSLGGQSSYGCTFQVQVNTSSNIAQTEKQIGDLLTKNFSKDSITLHAKSSDIQISHIEPGSCPEDRTQTKQGLYLWPQTEAQCTATKPCEGATSQTAYRFCKLDATSERANWTDPDLHFCPYIVNSIPELDDVTVTANNSADVVLMIANLTSNHKDISHSELVTVLNKLSEVLVVSQVTPSLGEAIVDIIADILESDSNLSPVTNQILNITESIGNMMTFGGESESIIAPSIAISVINVAPGVFRGISFGVSSISQGLNPEIFINEDPADDTVAFISLPQEVESRFPQQTEIPPRIQFHFYGAPQLFKDTQCSKELNTYVVSASITNATVSDLKHPVVVTLHHRKPNLLNDKVQCVYWDFRKNDGMGGWESSGCSQNHTSVYHTTCVCDHLTHFGVLLDVSRTPVSEENEEILTIISYLGCGISSIFLGVSLLTYTAFEKLRRDYPSKILINLSLALLGLNLVFLVNSWLSSFGSMGLCISVAASLHYFLLASFTWMGLGAVNMYLALVKVFNVYVPSYILKFCAVGWGVPLVIVSLILAVKRDAYGSAIYGKSPQPLNNSELFCWLQDDIVFYVSVVAYIGLILLFNLTVFLVVLVQIRNVRANRPTTSHSGLLHDLRGVASLTFLLGITWMLAFFTWGPAKVPLLYLFSGLNSLQGFFIFVFHCLMKENVRKQWRIHLCCGRFRLKEHSDWSQTATVGVKSRHNNLFRSPSMKSVGSDNTNSTCNTSNSSSMGQQLISTRRSDLKLAYENALPLPRAHCSPQPLPPQCTSVPGEFDLGIPPWPPADRSY